MPARAPAGWLTPLAALGARRFAADHGAAGELDALAVDVTVLRDDEVATVHLPSCVARAERRVRCGTVGQLVDTVGGRELGTCTCVPQLPAGGLLEAFSHLRFLARDQRQHAAKDQHADTVLAAAGSTLATFAWTQLCWLETVGRLPRPARSYGGQIAQHTETAQRFRDRIDALDRQARVEVTVRAEDTGPTPRPLSRRGQAGREAAARTAATADTVWLVWPHPRARDLRRVPARGWLWPVLATDPVSGIRAVAAPAGLDGRGLTRWTGWSPDDPQLADKVALYASLRSSGIGADTAITTVDDLTVLGERTS